MYVLFASVYSVIVFAFVLYVVIFLVALPFLKLKSNEKVSSARKKTATPKLNHDTINSIQENETNQTISKDSDFIDYIDIPSYEVDLDEVKKDYQNMLDSLQTTYHDVTPSLRAKRNLFNRKSINKFEVKHSNLNVKHHNRV